MYQQELKEKKLVELREMAKERGILQPYKFKKDELIQLLSKMLEHEPIVQEEVDTAKKIDISDIDLGDLSDKATEEIEQMDEIESAQGILELHSDGYGFLRRG